MVYLLCLWECCVIVFFLLESFNNGNYFEVQYVLIDVGNIIKVLYLNDNYEKGKILCLMQQYFYSVVLVCDILCCYEVVGYVLVDLLKYEIIQFNDMYLIIVIFELMCILIDEKLMLWEVVWVICLYIFVYINYILLLEVLEMWSELLI